MLSRPRRLLLPACPRSTCFGSFPLATALELPAEVLLLWESLQLLWLLASAGDPAHRRPAGQTCSLPSLLKWLPNANRLELLRENDLFLCDTKTCKFDRECLRIGDTVTCVCQFKGRRWISHS
ncbi:hypothetical protein E2320_022875, partial [Naja naja]